ncbi:MAG: hypothetical protein LDL47_03505 [Cyanobacteria bacterium KgW148]|nr:hypothetical protein [Cyanobacteria bacterium KgW148]
MDEIKPILEAMTLQPVAFFGGLFAGFLRLDPNQDPLKSWLNQQGAPPTASAPATEQRPQRSSIE